MELYYYIIHHHILVLDCIYFYGWLYPPYVDRRWPICLFSLKYLLCRNCLNVWEFDRPMGLAIPLCLPC